MTASEETVNSLMEFTVNSFMEFTGTNDREVARNYLGMCDDDLTMAVRLYLEQGGEINHDNEEEEEEDNLEEGGKPSYKYPSEPPPVTSYKPPSAVPYKPDKEEEEVVSLIHQIKAIKEKVLISKSDMSKKRNTDSTPINNDTTPYLERIKDWLSNNRQTCFWIVATLVAAGIILAASLKRVQNLEYGVQYDIHAKQLDDAAKSGGLFIGPPGFRFIKFPSTFISAEFNDRTCVSQDGLRVDFTVTFQYRIMEQDVPKAIKLYRNFNGWATVVEAAGLSAMHNTCSQYVISDFQNRRAEIQDALLENLKVKLEGDEVFQGVLAKVVSAQLRGFVLPRAYLEAISNKQEAEEDIALARAQRLQETTKATTELLAAEKEAIRILETATNEASIVLKEAQLEANAILYSYEKEKDAIVAAKNDLELSPDGLLAHSTSMMISEVERFSTTIGEPARMSRKDEL